MTQVKAERHNAIRSIVAEAADGASASSRVANQDELRRRLLKRGFDVTQATLSRDIHELKLIKGPSGYALPNGESEEESLPTIKAVFSSFGIEVRQAQNQLVLRTTHGSAQPVAAVIDREELKEVVGTIAGDDTVLIICPDKKDATALRQRFQEILR